MCLKNRETFHGFVCSSVLSSGHQNRDVHLTWRLQGKFNLSFFACILSTWKHLSGSSYLMQAQKRRNEMLRSIMSLIVLLLYNFQSTQGDKLISYM